MLSHTLVCLFVYVDAREVHIETAPPQKKLSLIWDLAYIQNNFNVFYTHQMVGWVDKKERERTGKKARIEPMPPTPPRRWLIQAVPNQGCLKIWTSDSL